MKPIPMLDLQLEYNYMKADIDRAIKKCLDHQHWIFGPEVEELEQKIASYLGVEHCIGCSSGSDALVLSLRALAIKLKGREYWDRGDLIITTPFTFTATGDAILRAGAKPLFVDIELDTYNIDPRKIREALGSVSKSENVVGIIPVHLYGQACNMSEIMAVAADSNLFVVEDVAQAFGGTWNGKKLGSIATTGCFSFFPSKNLGGFGDGGMVSTRDADIADLVRMLIKHGGKDKYNVDHIGYNSRLDTIQAAVILAKFKYIDDLNDKRIGIAAAYDRGIKGHEGLVRPLSQGQLNENSKHVYHQYTIRTTTQNREDYRDYLHREGVSTMVYYPFPLQKMRVFDDKHGKNSVSLENAEYVCNRVFSLPMEPLQTKKTTETIIDKVNEAIKYIAVKESHI